MLVLPVKKNESLIFGDKSNPIAVVEVMEILRERVALSVTATKAAPATRDEVALLLAQRRNA